MATFPLNKYVSFKTSLKFNHSRVVIMEPQVVTAPINFSIDSAVSPLKRETRGGYMVRLIGDGIFAPTFEGIKQHGKSEPFDSSQGAVNLVEFSFDGYEYFYRIYSPLKPILTESNMYPSQVLTNTTITTQQEDLLTLEGIEIITGDRSEIFSLVSFNVTEELVVIDNPQFGDNDNMDSFGKAIEVNLDYAVVSSNDDVPTTKQGMVSVYDSTTGDLIRHIQDPSGNNRSYKQFGHGLCLKDNHISVGYNVQWSESCYYMDVETGQVLHDLRRDDVPGSTESDYFAYATAISSDKVFVGAKGGTGYIAVFDRSTGAYIERIENTESTTGFGSHIQVDEKSNALITRSDDSSCIHVLDLTTYESIYVINVGGGTTSSSVFVYDGLLYVGVPQNYGGDGYVRVYDYVAGELVNTISSPSEHYGMENFGISVSASGRTLFVLDGYRPYDQNGVLKFEHGAIYGLSIDDNYSMAIQWQDPDWTPVGDHLKVYGNRMILGSPAYADDDGDYVSGKVRIFEISSIA